MASSSRSHQTLKNCNIPEEHNFFEEDKVSKVGQEEEEEEEDWLKLGLGLLGSGTSSSKIKVHGPNPVLDLPSPSFPSSQEILNSHQIGLGLGLGFEQGSSLRPQDNNDRLRGVVVMEQSSDYHNSNSVLGWSSDHCKYHHYYHHNDDDGMVLWPSCQIDSHQDLAMPIPCDSHHYRARSPHQNGLWFTLRSSTNR